MRLAFASWTDRQAGGAETYLSTVMTALAEAGHTVMLWHETVSPSGRDPLTLPPGTPTYRITGPEDVHRVYESTRPDAVFLQQGPSSAAWETALLERRSIFVAHNHAGTCISGTRAWSAPVMRPCNRTFGPWCLAHYFPHRCGGRSPLTMLRLYRLERGRLERLRRASAIVALSRYMQGIFLQHGFSAERVFHVPYGPPVPPDFENVLRPVRTAGAVRLITAARLEPLKGVHILLNALPLVRRLTGRALRLSVLGDGTSRPALERLAAAITAGEPDVSVQFKGWVNPSTRNGLLREHDLFILPSAGPETLGLAGIEALYAGLPVVAFDVGAVREWLTDGVNGRLVPADPPSPVPLARAIAEGVHSRWRGRSLPAVSWDLATPAEHADQLVNLVRRLAAGSSG